MKTFYAVTVGRYSSYHIIAITDNKERADDIAKIYYDDTWDDEPRVEEFVDSGVIDDVLWNVTAKADGSYYVYNEEFDKKDVNVIKEVLPSIFNNFGKIGEKYSVCVFAKFEDQAIKIAQDLWAEYKAKKEGIV